jgi:hypothetical protein
MMGPEVLLLRSSLSAKDSLAMLSSLVRECLEALGLMAPPGAWDGVERGLALTRASTP